MWVTDLNKGMLNYRPKKATTRLSMGGLFIKSLHSSSFKGKVCDVVLPVPGQQTQGDSGLGFR